MANTVFLINYYLLTAEGEYALTDPTDPSSRIILSTVSVSIDHDYQALGGQASHTRRLPAVKSFEIKTNESQDDWHLIINKHVFVGRYPTQAAAISVLYGIMYQHSGHEDSFAFALEDMVNRGGSIIDPEGDNIMSQEIENGEFKAKIINFARDSFVGDATIDFSANEVWLYEDATPLLQQTLVLDSTQEYSIPARYDNDYQSVFKVDKNFVPTFNENTLPAISIGVIDVNISFPAGTPIVDQPLTATATVTGYDSRIPIKYQWTWKENPSGSNTTVKTETTTSSTSSYTPTNTANYRAEVELLYALDDVTTGVSDSETSSNAFQPFDWVQGPEILNLAQDQYYVFPTEPTDYIGNSPVSFAYEWMKNGSPFGTDSASQLLTDPGNYTVDVTGSNSVNGQTYTDTSLSRNSITIAEPSSDVADIKLFPAITGSGDTAQPSGSEVIDPEPGTTYYAFAYDQNGDLISGGPVEWTYSVEGSEVVPGSGFTGATPQPADVLPGAGETFALDSMPVAHWSELPLRTVEGDFVELNVVADHYNGIDRVEFIANDGTPTAVTSTVTKYDEDPNFGTDVYSAQLDMSGVAAGDTIEARAVIYPTAGRPRVLQGDLVWVDTASNDGKEGKRSSYITKISGVTQVVVSSGTVIDAIDGLDVTGTTQYELAFAPGTFELGASSVPAVTGVNQNIPIRILGSGGRSTRIIRSTYDAANWMGGFPLEWENCTIVASTFGLQTSDNNAMNIFKDCSLIGEYEPYVGSYTDGTGTIITAQEFIDYNTPTPDLGPNSNITIWGADQRDGTGFTSTPVFSAASNEQRGVYLQDCTIDLELGSGVLWMRSTTSVNAIGDNSHCAAVIGLRTEGSSYGGYVDVNLLKNDYLVWEPNRTYADGDNVIVPKGVLLDYDPTDEQGNTLSRYRMHIYRCAVTHQSPAEFVYDANWEDPLPPHIDGWQGRRTESGDHTFDNIWISEFTTDDKCSHQPFLYRELELLTNMIWKNWDIVAISYPNTQIAQLSTHVNHWLVDNVVFPDGDTALTGPELRLQWNDPAYPSAANGWGDDLSTDVGFESVGCRNSKWSNSKMRNLILGSSWGDGNLPADMTAFQTQMNSNAGSFVGWDLAIDASTITDSYLEANSPEAPYNAATTQGAGTSEVGETISVNTSADGTEPITLTYVWDLDGNVVAGEDAATYPKTGTIPSGDEGKVPTCTVTYTNAYGSDEDSHTFAAVAPAGGAETWDTYEDGIFKVPLASQNPSGSFVKDTVAYGSTTTATFEGWYRSANNPASRYWDGSADTLPPAIAVWNETTQAWLGWSNPETPGGSTTDAIKWNQNGPTADYWTFAHQDDELYVVYLSQDPTAFGSWGAYDGPSGGSVIGTYDKTGHIGASVGDNEPRMLNAGNWRQFEEGTGGGTFTGDFQVHLEISSGVELTPDPGYTPQGGNLKIPKAPGSSTMSQDYQIRLTYFEPGTTNQRSAPVLSTSHVLSSGNYYFTFSPALTRANTDHDGEGAWGWLDGDDVLFELIDTSS